MPMVPEGPVPPPQVEKPSDSNMLMAAADMDRMGKLNNVREIIGLMGPQNNIIDWINYAARKTTGDLLFPGERLAKHRAQKIEDDIKLTRENKESDVETAYNPKPRK